MATPKPTSDRPQEKKVIDMSFSSMIGKSRRLTLTYVVLIVWVGMAIFGILVDTDLYALAVYFASGLPLILGYLWSETSRPTARDAADIIRGIGMRPGNNNYGGGSYGGYGGYGGYGYGGYGGYGGHYHNDHNDRDRNYDNSDSNNSNIDQVVSIYSDDASVELRVNQNQLSTLKNMGYVDKIADKYTFKKSQLEEIKSLIDENLRDPDL